MTFKLADMLKQLSRLRDARGKCSDGTSKASTISFEFAFYHAAVRRLGVVVRFRGGHWLTGGVKQCRVKMEISMSEAQQVSQGGRAVGFNTTTLATSGMGP